MSAPQPTMVPQLEDNVHKWQDRERSRSPGRVLNNDDKFKFIASNFRQTDFQLKLCMSGLDEKSSSNLRGKEL